MKKILQLLLLAGLTSLIACGPNSEKNAANEKAKADSIAVVKKIQDSIANMETMKMTLAKQWSDLMYSYIEQSEMKKLSKKQLDKLAAPLKVKQDSFRLTLSPAQIKELDDYFQKKGNEMVDRLLEYRKNK